MGMGMGMGMGSDIDAARLVRAARSAPAASMRRIAASAHVGSVEAAEALRSVDARGRCDATAGVALTSRFDERGVAALASGYVGDLQRRCVCVNSIDVPRVCSTAPRPGRSGRSLIPAPAAGCGRVGGIPPTPMGVSA